VSGRFISFEGGEGSGKSTQLKRLAERLGSRGDVVVTTREPGGTPGAEEIRSLLVRGEPGRWEGVTEALLINAARADHVARCIRPALEAGKWVISDRFVHSTLAYQGAARGLREEDLRTLHDFSTGDLWPDLTLILDVPPEAGLARAAGRQDGEARFEAEETAFHDAVRRRMLAFADVPNCRIVDASRPIDAVAADIWSIVVERFDLT
jgi:dTMP kinase